MLARNRAPAAAAEIGVNEDEGEVEVAEETAVGGEVPYGKRAEGMRTP